jgi:proline iminopeptidase
MTRLKIFMVLLLFTAVCGFAAEPILYSNAFGKNTDPAVIYFHGGPGFNCANFEFSTAEELSKKGLYVIVFDQRGCGRSKQYFTHGPYTFAAQIEDVLSLYKKYNLTKASLMGHSWGGSLATKFAEAHPDKVERMILIGSPMSYQMTLRGILHRCRDKFEFKHDSINLKRVAFVEKMDTTSIAYSGSCFMFAVANNLYTSSSKTEFSEKFNKEMEENEDNYLLSQIEQEPVQGVYDAEKYITLHFYNSWHNLKNSFPLYGIYGSQDGLFDKKQLDEIEIAVGAGHFYIVTGASHNVFIDQHSDFMDIVSKIFFPPSPKKHK